MSRCYDQENRILRTVLGKFVTNLDAVAFIWIFNVGENGYILITSNLDQVRFQIHFNLTLIGHFP